MKSLLHLTRRRALHNFAIPRVLPIQSSAASNRLCQRNFSASSVAASQLAGLDPTKLAVTKTTTPKELTASKDLVFGKTFTGTHPLSNAQHYCVDKLLTLRPLSPRSYALH